VNARRQHRRHAARVAAIATGLILVGYVVTVIILNVVVAHRLTSNTDARLADQLNDAAQRTLVIPGGRPAARSSKEDLDDAPEFLWSVSPSGQTTALTKSAPALPHWDWSDAPITLDIGTTAFRFDAIVSHGQTLVAGQSVAGTEGVESALLVPELVFGSVLLVVAFAGAWAVGLRASAPSELVRRRQAEFTADASHELRTPLSVIEAEVDLALRRTREPRAYQEVLGRVADESRRLRRIVENLLWLARADDAPAVVGAGDSVDVADAVTASVERFGAVAVTRNVAISVRREGAGPYRVQATADWIDRLTGVLIDNACKYAGPDGQVEVRVRSTGNRVELRVDDSGPGIPENEREAVFDRFHRATDTAGGTGLGLAIADSVVRATEGTWTIGTAPLGGARMEVSWRKLGSRKGGPNPQADRIS
jgi:signal transduction histidine kinase